MIPNGWIYLEFTVLLIIKDEVLLFFCKSNKIDEHFTTVYL